MAIEKAFLRQSFDRSREFVAVKTFLYSGQSIPSGQLFDKTTCSVRLLRQLYEGRYLRYATSEEAPVKLTDLDTRGTDAPRIEEGPPKRVRLDEENVA